MNCYKILTVTHKTTNLKQLGDFAIVDSAHDSPKVKLEDMKSLYNITEFMYMATCNRVMYLFCKEDDIDEHFILNFFKYANPNLSDADDERILDVVSFYEGPDAVEHLFEVAASIDSLVVGEREILRQVRDAVKQCRKWKLTGDSIRLLTSQMVSAAKEVYNQTRIGEKPVSVVSLAIQKLLASSLTQNSRLLLVGAGQTNNLVAKFLVKHEYKNVVVFNRTEEKAQRLARRIGGTADSLANLENHDTGFDGIITCTGAQEPIITADIYQKILGGDTRKKLIIDLAVPHDTANEVINDSNVKYIDIEDLRSLADENMSFREQEVSKARKILKTYLDEYGLKFEQRQIEKAMKDVPKQIKAVRPKIMNEVFKDEIEQLPEENQDLLNRILAYMEKKCISIPMVVARNMIVEEKKVNPQELPEILPEGTAE